MAVQIAEQGRPEQEAALEFTGKLRDFRNVLRLALPFCAKPGTDDRMALSFVRLHVEKDSCFAEACCGYAIIRVDIFGDCVGTGDILIPYEVAKKVAKLSNSDVRYADVRVCREEIETVPLVLSEKWGPLPPLHWPDTDTLWKTVQAAETVQEGLFNVALLGQLLGAMRELSSAPATVRIFQDRYGKFLRMTGHANFYRFDAVLMGMRE